MTSIALSTLLLFASTLTGMANGIPQRHADRRAAEVSARTLHCNIRITSYRFLGQPGTSIQWGERSYSVPATGMIELLPNRKVARYATSAGDFTLPTEGPVDQFGMLTIDLASNQIVPVYKLPVSQTAPILLGSFDDVLAQ